MPDFTEYYRLQRRRATALREGLCTCCAFIHRAGDPWPRPVRAAYIWITPVGSREHPCETCYRIWLENAEGRSADAAGGGHGDRESIMTASDRVPAEDIVEALAKLNEPVVATHRCVLCHGDLLHVSRNKLDGHYADCPWRLAREWVDFS